MSPCQSPMVDICWRSSWVSWNVVRFWGPSRKNTKYNPLQNETPISSNEPTISFGSYFGLWWQLKWPQMALNDQKIGKFWELTKGAWRGRPTPPPSDVVHPKVGCECEVTSFTAEGDMPYHKDCLARQQGLWPVHLVHSPVSGLGGQWASPWPESLSWRFGTSR